MFRTTIILILSLVLSIVLSTVLSTYVFADLNVKFFDEDSSNCLNCLYTKINYTHFFRIYNPDYHKTKIATTNITFEYCVNFKCHTTYIDSIKSYKVANIASIYFENTSGTDISVLFNTSYISYLLNISYPITLSNITIICINMTYDNNKFLIDQNYTGNLSGNRTNFNGGFDNKIDDKTDNKTSKINKLVWTRKSVHVCRIYQLKDLSDEICNISFVTILKDGGFILNHSIKFKFITYDGNNKNRFPYFINYYIEDLYGDIVKKPINTSNTNIKSFTKRDGGFMVYALNATLHTLCKNINKHLSQKTFFVINNPSSKRHKNLSKIPVNPDISADESKHKNLKNNSIINITKLSCKNYLMVDLEIYKGNTRKYLVDVFIVDKNNKKISETTKFYLRNRFQTTKLRIPIIQDKHHHLSDFNGKKLIVRGLGVFLEYDIGDICLKSSKMSNSLSKTTSDLSDLDTSTINLVDVCNFSKDYRKECNITKDSKKNNNTRIIQQLVFDCARADRLKNFSGFMDKKLIYLSKNFKFRQNIGYILILIFGIHSALLLRHA